MRIPVIQGIIGRRILVNYRADPQVVKRLLPVGMRPQLYAGHAWVGICLIRLEQTRPRAVPRLLGISSENAAHRFAVEWQDDSGSPRQGVYVQRRDTSARINHWAGGRVFPGKHHLARFDVVDQDGRVKIAIRSHDGQVRVNVDGHCVDGHGTVTWPSDSAFESLQEASDFFRQASLGYSPSRDVGRLDGLLLNIPDWQVQPLSTTRADSSFFDDRSNFPQGTIAFDHALLMRDAQHEWHHAACLHLNEIH